MGLSRPRGPGPGPGLLGARRGRAVGGSLVARPLAPTGDPRSPAPPDRRGGPGPPRGRQQRPDAEARRAARHGTTRLRARAPDPRAVRAARDRPVGGGAQRQRGLRRERVRGAAAHVAAAVPRLPLLDRQRAVPQRLQVVARLLRTQRRLPEPLRLRPAAAARRHGARARPRRTVGAASRGGGLQPGSRRAAAVVARRDTRDAQQGAGRHRGRPHPGRAGQPPLPPRRAALPVGPRAGRPAPGRRRAARRTPLRAVQRPGRGAAVHPCRAAGAKRAAAPRRRAQHAGSRDGRRRGLRRGGAG